jgi:glutathione peroxidase
LNYGVTFPVTAKTHVVKDPVEPLYQWLAGSAKPKWNFHKYLFNAQGHLVESFLPITAPHDKHLIGAIQSLIKE